MTKNRAAKEAIRERMAKDGISYAQAARKLAVVKALEAVTVYELGENSDSWFVEGTIEPSVAKLALYDWFELTDPPAIAEIWHPDIEHKRLAGREDWFFQALDPNHLDAEAVLKSIQRTPQDHRGEPLMRGVLIQT